MFYCVFPPAKHTTIASCVAYVDCALPCVVHQLCVSTPIKQSDDTSTSALTEYGTVFRYSTLILCTVPTVPSDQLIGRGGEGKGKEELGGRRRGQKEGAEGREGGWRGEGTGREKSELNPSLPCQILNTYSTYVIGNDSL